MYAEHSWADLSGYGPHSYWDWRAMRTIDGKACLVDLDAMNIASFVGEFSAFQQFLCQQTHGFVLLYDVTSRKEFRSVSIAIDLLMENTYKKNISENNAPSSIVAASGPSAGGTSRSALRKLKARICGREGPSSMHHTEQQIPDKFTCFPRLPAELQLAILRVCATSSYPIVDNKPHLSGINMNFLQVCKFFHEEGTRIFWAENTFVSSKLIYVVADMTYVTPDNQRVITLAEGQALADQYGCKFFESSSRVHEDVEAVSLDKATADIALSVPSQEVSNEGRLACLDDYATVYIDEENGVFTFSL
ncbi:hypothetical protein EYZ11_005606 [Aspergillus tanneri]|uniref:Uncharacterized protein n=1 Tax=Aspergillus tanneri TaxID=1220188 RepID=A0A4S3JHR4_9EURO|nr:hypothetical protein EYZ11_005606 [Aspergillus tanneri]